MKKSFIANTMIVIISGFIIKILGLLNRILITRLLGPSGVSLYILSFPTIMLFISISGMSLNISTSKLVAESLKLKNYSPRKIIFKSIILALIVSTFTTCIFLIILKPLCYSFLKEPNLYYPLLTTVFLIPLVGISDTLKGYFNGLKEMGISALSTVIEQIFRISFSIAAIFLLRPHGLIVTTVFILLSLSIGEIASIIFSIIKILKYRPPHYPKTKNEFNAICSISIPTTLTRLMGNFIYFLEPIVYTAVFTYLNYAQADITNEYTIVNAYTIPLLTTVSFLSFAISTSVIPVMAENWALKRTDAVHHYISEALILSLIPGILIAVLFYYFPSEYMNLIYGTTLGSDQIRNLTFIFLFYYIHPPVVAILQAIGKSKFIFAISTISNVLKIALLALLAFVPTIGLDSMLYAIIFSMILSTVICLMTMLKVTNFSFNLRKVFNLVMLFLFTFGLTGVLNFLLKEKFLITSLISTICFIIICFKLNFFRFFKFQKRARV
ncbi:MAG: oligosaccharide flippase family protein [Bacilli bacterium]